MTQNGQKRSKNYKFWGLRSSRCIKQMSSWQVMLLHQHVARLSRSFGELTGGSRGNLGKLRKSQGNLGELHHEPPLQEID